jgi:hypothetical protein
LRPEFVQEIAHLTPRGTRACWPSWLHFLKSTCGLVVSQFEN